VRVKVPFSFTVPEMVPFADAESTGRSVHQKTSEQMARIRIRRILTLTAGSRGHGGHELGLIVSCGQSMLNWGCKYERSQDGGHKRIRSQD
jgi:hypothetical protein